MTCNTALIIDDDPLFQIVAEEVLRASGVETVEKANDGMIGLKQVVSQPGKFDLIICDLQMPNLDGVGVIRELARVKYSGTVIIVSSEDRRLIQTVHNMGRMLGVRIGGALKKPIDVVALQTIMHKQQAHNHSSRQTIGRGQLERSIVEKFLRPFYQPKINLRENRVSGFEILCRFVAPDGHVSGPADYLHAAMRYDMIGELTRSIVEQTISDISGWDEQIGPFGIAINMSPACITNPGLPDALERKFTSAGIAPRTVTFEITEDKLLENQVVILEVMSRLRLAGFQLSLDDFGTGAASIEQLRLFPFTELKIDRQFVMEAEHDEFSHLALKTGAKFAAMLGLKVVAEGVETAEALKLATMAGATEVQGYYFSKALPPEEILDWVKAFHRRIPQAA